MPPHETSPASHRLEFDEGGLQVYTAGATGSPVLLLSGAGVDNAMLSWRRLIPELAESHQVLALDWPKQGRSRPWRGTATHERMLRCITDVLDHFQFERAGLVGLSQGGALALATAIESPDRVDRLVAIAPAGIIAFPPVVHQALWLVAKLPLFNTTLPKRMLSSRNRVAAFVRSSLFAGPVEDFEQVVDEIVEEVQSSGAAATDWQNGSIGFLRMNVDLRARLSEITAPTLFIQGDRDRAVAPRHTTAAAGRVPGARLEMITGNGHWVNRQSPELVNQLIKDFLATP
jgi:pimeloyl-ACP methyl ester carboxylesterase